MRWVDGNPASVKSSTGAPPASTRCQRSLPAPVPVTLAAPTRRPDRVMPRTSDAADVVLPAFIEAPTTATTGGCSGGGAVSSGIGAPERTVSPRPSGPAS